MKNATLVGIVALAMCGHVAAQSYAHCLLDKLPGATNATYSHAVTQACLREYPSGFKGVVQGSGKGFLSYKDGAACIIKKADGTTHQQAAHVIGMACRCLYDTSLVDARGFRRTYCAD